MVSGCQSIHKWYLWLRKSLSGITTDLPLLENAVWGCVTLSWVMSAQWMMIQNTATCYTCTTSQCSFWDSEKSLPMIYTSLHNVTCCSMCWPPYTAGWHYVHAMNQDGILHYHLQLHTTQHTPHKAARSADRLWLHDETYRNPLWNSRTHLSTEI